MVISSIRWWWWWWWCSLGPKPRLEPELHKLVRVFVLPLLIGSLLCQIFSTAEKSSTNPQPMVSGQAEGDDFCSQICHWSMVVVVLVNPAEKGRSPSVLRSDQQSPWASFQPW